MALRSNELMIGDWVYCEGQPAPNNVIIQSIHEDGVWFQGEEFEGAASYDRIFPIPLTPEILEKNGFGEQGFERMSVWSILGFSIELHFSTWKYYWANGDVEISSVHELQHALRLCGIDKTIEL